MVTLGKMVSWHLSSTEKGIFTIDLAQIKMDWDDFEMEMIDGGAEDVEKDEEEVMITTAFEDFWFSISQIGCAWN